MRDVRISEKGILHIKLDTGNKTVTTLLRNIKNPASPESVWEIVHAAEKVLEYPLKSVEMTMNVEYIEG